MRSRWLFSLLLLATLPVLAQIPASNRNKCTIRIDVLNAEGGHAPGNLRVQLMQRNMTVGMRFTDGEGVAEFSELAPGQYHAQVNGEGYENADSGMIELDDWNVFLSKAIVLHRKVDASQKSSGNTPTISVADLNVPDKASKEYKHGNEEMAEQHWDKALEHFNKAVQIAPQFSSAYNNLAVCYGQLGDREREHQALQKALGADQRSVVALVNLARMAMEDKKPEEASPLLNRALAVDPANLSALSLLAETEYAEGHYAEAIAQAHKVHGMPHPNYARVHYTAAQAYEHLNRASDAVLELQLYLKEEPNGTKAAFIRKVLPEMEKEASTASAQQ